LEEKRLSYYFTKKPAKATGVIDQIGMKLFQKKPVVTFIGFRQAKKGFIFIHQGPSSECADCEYYQVCIKNLEVGRVYRIVRLREKIFPCKLHEAGARVVEVVESEILATISSKLAIEGAVITFQRQECDMQTCEHYEHCVPRGLIDGDRCTILEVGENVSCSMGLSLVKAVLCRLPAS